MKRIILVAQLVLIICAGCTSIQIVSKGYELPIELNEIKTALVDTAFFQSSLVVPLESNDSSLIRFINRVCMVNDTLYLLDRSLNKVFIYSDSGKYLGQINDMGSGPGEYIQISDITVDQKRNNIAVLCDRPYKIMYYTHEGKLVEEFPCSNYFSEFVMKGNNIYCYDVGGKNIDNLITYVYPMKLIKKEALHERPYFDSKKAGTSFSFDDGNRLTISNAIYFTRSFEDYIYTIDYNGVYEKYDIDFKKHQLPQSLLEKGMSSWDFLNVCDENKYICSITNVIGNRDYLFFETNLGVFVYDKQSRRLDGYRFILNSSLQGGTSHYLPINNSSQIVQILQPSQFKQYIDSRQKREKNMNQLNLIYKNVYQNLNNEDNPILIIYKLPNSNNMDED